MYIYIYPNPENHRFTLPTVYRFALPSDFEIDIKLIKFDGSFDYALFNGSFDYALSH